MWQKHYYTVIACINDPTIFTWFYLIVGRAHKIPVLLEGENNEIY